VFKLVEQPLCCLHGVYLMDNQGDRVPDDATAEYIQENQAEKKNLLTVRGATMGSLFFIGVGCLVAWILNVWVELAIALGVYVYVGVLFVVYLLCCTVLYCIALYIVLYCIIHHNMT